MARLLAKSDDPGLVEETCLEKIPFPKWGPGLPSRIIIPIPVTLGLTGGGLVGYLSGSNLAESQATTLAHWIGRILGIPVGPWIARDAGWLLGLIAGGFLGILVGLIIGYIWKTKR
jgi:hypothetical protein